MASATVGFPIASYQLSVGSCEVMMIDLRPCRSSIISSRIGRSLASRFTRNRSSNMSSVLRSILLSSDSSVPFNFATFDTFAYILFRYTVMVKLEGDSTKALSFG